MVRQISQGGQRKEPTVFAHSLQDCRDNLYKKATIVPYEMSSNKVEVFRALSSNVRQSMIRMLFRESLGVDELAERLGLQPVSVRHHLKPLEEASIIESYEEEPKGVGRPRVLYHIARRPDPVTFPRRDYLALSEFFISTAELLLGRTEAEKLLSSVGLEMGEITCKRIEAENRIREWSLKAFEEHFIRGYLQEAGAEPEIANSDNGSITYRLHNCLLLELAVKYPELICRAYHDSYDLGLSRGTGQRLRIARKSCIGEGAPYCEHICESAEVSAVKNSPGRRRKNDGDGKPLSSV